MLPAAKVLLVTVLVGGGTVGTYALAGGKFGSGSGGNGNAETAQASTPESTTPTTDGQARAGDAAPIASESPAAPRGEEALEVGAEDRDSSDTPEGTNGGKDADSAKGREEETISTEEQQRNSQRETVSAGGDQETARPETPGVSEDDAKEPKTNLEGGSNESGTDSRDKTASEAQVGQQNVEAKGGENIQENSASRDNQGAVDSSSTNTDQNVQSAVGSAQDKGNADGENQTDVTGTTDSNTNEGGSSLAGQTQS